MKKDNQLIASLSPWPTISEHGEIRPGTIVDTHPTCKTCEHKACSKIAFTVKQGEVEERVCSKGLSVYMDGDAQTIRFVGLGNPARHGLPRSFKRLKSLRIRPEVVKAWVKAALDAIAEASKEEETVEDASVGVTRSLHNIQPAANIVVRCAEELISHCEGPNFDTKLSSAPKYIKNLYYGTKLITWMIDIQHNLVNPDSISYGRKQPRPIYAMIDRLVRSFRLIGDPQNIRIVLNGNSYHHIDCYESLANLFVILLDNAVKYSFENQDVIININDSGDAIDISISNYGPMVDRDELEKIFLPGYRGKFGRDYTDLGTGRGLYIAKLIVEKHNATMKCSPSYSSVKIIDGLPYAETIFQIRLK